MHCRISVSYTPACKFCLCIHTLILLLCQCSQMRGYNRSRREWLRVRRQQYLQRGAVRVRPSVGVHRNSKEAATDHFERKQQQKMKTRLLYGSFLSLHESISYMSSALV